MSVGRYQVIVEWTNNQSYLMRDKVGFIQFGFNVWHHSNLTAVESYLETIAGEPLLIKVNFSDCDINTCIDFATIAYNSTFGESGTMVYVGSGIYIIDLDTSSLELGDYYFSFNASKSYYESQSTKDLIHLKILVQPLALEVPHTVINAMANSYAICQINVTGAISGTLLWPANVTSDWNKPYTVIDHHNGTYTLNLSTYDVPSRGIFETFTITVFANITNYGNIYGYITLTVHPIPTVVNVNETAVDVSFNSHFCLKVNYTIEESGELISGANCSLTWPSSYKITSTVEGFIISFNTTGLMIDVYTAIVILDHAGYETAFKSIIITVNPIEIDVIPIDFEDSIEANKGENIAIEIFVKESGTNHYIEGANVTYSWQYGIGTLKEIGGGIYELNLKIPENIDGSYKINIIISKEGNIYKTAQFSFYITISEGKPSNFLLSIILYVSIGIIGVLSILSLRTYVFLPRKRRKESKLLAKTQKFKDIRNIQAIIGSEKNSGIPVYFKTYSIFKEQDIMGFSGFIQAISIVGETYSKNKKEAIKKENEVKKFGIAIKELDFKYFHALICDYEDLRFTLVLKEKSSERLREQIQVFTKEAYFLSKELLQSFTGEIEAFKKIISPIIHQIFPLYYKEPFKITEVSTISPSFKKSRKLTLMEMRILNVLQSYLKHNKEFYLETILELVDEKDENKVIEAIESLLKQKILISYDFIRS